MDELNSVAAEQALGVEEQSTNEESLNGGGATENVQANEQPSGQSREENAFVKQLRLEKEQAEARAAKLERDNIIAQKYGREYGVYSEADIANNYGHQGITTLEELENAIEAQKSNIDPELYNTIKTLEKEVNEGKALKKQIQQKEQLSNDPNVGKFFNANEAEIVKLANSFQGDLKGDLDIALTILMRQKFPDYLNQIEAHKTNQQNAESSTGSLTGNGNSKDTTLTDEMVSEMSPSELAKRWPEVKKLYKMK